MTNNFDQTDAKNLGRSLYFNLKDHILAVESLIKSDEIELALKLCDMLPAWERENYPIELTEIKNTLFKNLYDSYEYSSESAIEIGWTKEDAIKQFKSGYFYPRADLLAKRLPRSDFDNPWICEFSPSHGAMALGLLDAGFKFNYFAKNLNNHATDTLMSWLPDDVWQIAPYIGQKTIFVFMEALEHTYREKDLLYSYGKLGIDFDEIYLSVPYGTLFGGLPNWQTRKLGHVRTYSKKDFIELAQDFFPNRSWELTVSHSLVLVGKK